MILTKNTPNLRMIHKLMAIQIIVHYKSKNIPPATDNDPGVNTSGNNKFSQIFNTISDIKYISKVHKNELEKHNTILDYTSELVDTTEDKIFRNQLKIKKILD